MKLIARSASAVMVRLGLTPEVGRHHRPVTDVHILVVENAMARINHAVSA